LPRDQRLVAPVELASAFELANAVSPVRAAGSVAALAARRLQADPGGRSGAPGAALPAPAARRGADPGRGSLTMAIGLPLSVDEMRLTDIPQVHEVERLSFATPWPQHAFEQELRGNRLARYVVARTTVGGEERVVGFAGVWLMVDEAHITTFGVHPDFRRQGVGRRLLLRLADLAMELRARRLTLEVRVSNTAAQGLYRRFGFTISGTRPRYYTDDGEDAYVMTTPDLVRPVMQSLIADERRAQEDG
jgi:ribosomal-protein-alanine N-acetyltransferase